MGKDVLLRSLAAKTGAARPLELLRRSEERNPEDWPELGRAVFDAHAPLAGRVSEKRHTTSSSS